MKTCSACHMKNLDWVQLDGKWKLYDIDGQLHKCTGVFPIAQAPKVYACRHGILKINWCDFCDMERNRE